MSKRISILLVDHGSRRDEANQSLEQMAALIARAAEASRVGALWRFQRHRLMQRMVILLDIFG